MISECYSKRLTNLPRKKREDHHTLTNQGWIIELFPLVTLISCLVNLIENLPDYRLETCLEIILQLTDASCQIVDSIEKCHKKIKTKLFKDKQNFFSLLGDKQNFEFV